MKHYQRVREFMKAVGQELPAEFTVPSDEVTKLRAKLILEEAIETVEALGYYMVIPGFGYMMSDKVKHIDLARIQNPDPEMVLDGCADLSVVTMGTLLAFGIQDEEPLLAEVDEANMTKVIGGYRREDGKWMKPPSWRPPDIQRIIDLNSTPPSKIKGSSNSE